MVCAHVESEVRAVARQQGIDPASLLAIVEVESGGRALTEVGGRMMPLILYEYHVFHRRLRPALRAGAVRAGLASQRWGQIPYPRSQRERYALLARAKLIDREAAYAACSWGVGQVLGENARWLGYESAEALADEAISGVAGQVRIMLRFIERRGLAPVLADRHWVRFAEGYNGPQQALHDYAGRMAAAHARWMRRPAAPPPPWPILAIGARGPGVERLQHALRGAGQPVIVDGIFGAATQAALRRYQRDNGLVCDGIAGPQSWARLEAPDVRCTA